MQSYVIERLPLCANCRQYAFEIACVRFYSSFAVCMRHQQLKRITNFVSLGRFALFESNCRVLLYIFAMRLLSMDEEIPALSLPNFERFARGASVLTIWSHRICQLLIPKIHIIICWWKKTFNFSNIQSNRKYTKNKLKKKKNNFFIDHLL